MEPYFAIRFLKASAPILIASAALLGYVLGKRTGAILLFGLSAAAAGVMFFSGVFLGWGGLIFTMAALAVLAGLAGRHLSGPRGAWVLSLLWVGWCAASILGYQVIYGPLYQAAYQAAYNTAYQQTYQRAYQTAYLQTYQASGRLAAEAAGRAAGQSIAPPAARDAGKKAGRAVSTDGFVLITLPSLALFWLGAFALSQKLLPLGKQVPRDKRLEAFRALLTYTLGTNRPYYAVENGQALLRAPGNLFRQFLAGPGIIISGCDHTTVISDGIKIKGVTEPGLAFTDKFERIDQVVDLRVQLGATLVEALTKDGIRVTAPVFVPFRINAGNDWPQLNACFPFRKSAVLTAVRAQPIEHLREEQAGKSVENRQKRTWDEVVSIAAEQIFRRIIGQYSFDGLYAPDLSQQTPRPIQYPRQKIAAELQRQLRDELRPQGIQVIGGGIGNIQPVDDALVQQRIANWQAEWVRRMTVTLGEGDAEYIRLVEAARAQAQADMLRTISEGLEKVGMVDPAISTEVIALRFVEALEKMIQSPAVQRALPPASVEAIETMKHALGAHTH